MKKSLARAHFASTCVQQNRAFLRMEAPQEPKTNIVLIAGNIGTGSTPTPQEVTGNHRLFILLNKKLSTLIFRINFVQWILSLE